MLRSAARRLSAAVGQSVRPALGYLPLDRRQFSTRPIDLQAGPLRMVGAMCEHAHVGLLAAHSEGLSRWRTTELQQLLEAGDAHAARALFNTLLGSGEAEAYQLGVMLKACGRSEEQRVLLDWAETCGVEPEACTFNVMLGQLRFEGLEEEAHELQAEMARRGI